MRIVFVTSRFPFGNREGFLNAELLELANYFERVTVMPVHTPAGNPGDSSVTDLLCWPLVSLGLLWRALNIFRRRPRQTIGAVASILRSHDPGRTKNLGVVLKGLALGDWAMRERIGHIHAYWLSTPSTVAMIASQVSGIPWSSTAHRWDIYERNAFDVKQSSVAFVRAISARGAADIRSRMPVLEDRVVHIPLGAQVPPARPASRMRGGRFTIVCPASLVPVKGHADLLMALAKLRDAGVGFRCLMCGSGPLASALEQRAAALYLSEFVQFKGYVPQTTLHEWYCSGTVDAVVLASQAAGEKAMEGIPCALIEAMAFRIPVVATDSGSVAELVDDDCGRLVPPGDTDAFAEALLDVAVYPAGARARAERAYAKVQRCHDVRVQMRLLATALGA